MEHEKCYVFKPTDERSSKRRRVAARESPSWTLRKRTCRELWEVQEGRINKIVADVHRSTQDEITTFIKDSDFSPDQGSRIPAGLVVAGPAIASHAQFFDSLAERVSNETESVFVSLKSTECPNLKTLLKNVIRKATAAEEDDGDEHVVTRRKGPKLLNYDLQLLYEWCQDQQPKHVVVTFQDSEAFDGPLLADTIQLMSSWLDRIPFVLLFGIGTSAEGFQEKLPSTAIRCLRGQKFDVTQADEVLEQVFRTTLHGDQPLWLGPELASRILERHKDHIQSVETFADALKYAYMSHFFANPLSIFLRKGLKYKDVSKEDLEALRNLGSFRRLIEDLLEQRHADVVRALLESDETLFDWTKEYANAARIRMGDIVDTIDILQKLRTCIPRLPRIPLSTLYVRAASGTLLDSPLLRDFLLSVKKAPSDVLARLLAVLHKADAGVDVISRLMESLDKLVSAQPNQPLRSAHDHSATTTLRTTVVAQKVSLAKSASSMSNGDAEYSQIVDELHGRLDGFFREMLLKPQDLFLHEVVVYDLKSPHRDVFMPRPRYVVERALSRPWDYLSCVCCEGSKEGALSPTQPPVAILYQLYLESGNLINVHDLWLAFNAIIGQESDNDAETIMALFQRSLAELRYLGFIKASRKKTDHVAKLAWKGL
ncbi:origin recognition complex subunit [Phyllosticta capitalensis]|uniref:Origin recognition complex subunit n=1 Tax=Phyllosticta capitalensis TaxID=121624 RepID=A0ABR1YE87_9PEZI